MAGLKLYWESVQNAVSYNVYWKTSPGVTTSDSVVSGITNVVFHHLGLQENTTYYYIIVAVDGAGNLGPPSVEFSGETSVISSLTISPNNANVGVGAQQRYTATVTFSDGYSQDVSAGTTWDTSDHSIATIDSTGLATALVVGNATIDGYYLTFSATAPLIVSHTLTSIDIAPTNANILALTNQQYTATGHYNDFSTSDITTQVTWHSTNASAATISNSLGSEGYATAGNGGTTTISATLGLVSASTTLSITPILQSISISPSTPTITFPNTQQFAAIGHYSDSTTQDLTGAVSWNSSNTSVATIASGGLMTPVVHGTTTITATLGISGNTVATIAAILNSISVTPAPLSVYYPGNTQQLAAIGHYNDSTTQDLTSLATWSSSATGVATVSSSGLVTAVAGGTTNVTATYTAVTSNTDVVTVPAWQTQSNPGSDVMSCITGMNDGQIIAGGSHGGSAPAIWRWDGITWGAVVQGGVFATQLAVSSVSISLDNTTFFANNTRNIGKSTDGGITWYQLSDPPIGNGVFGVAAIDVNNIWTWTGNGAMAFQKSSDGGVTWVVSTSTGTDNITGFFMLNANSIYAYGALGSGACGTIWHYNGSTWSKLTTSWVDANTAPIKNVTSMWADADNNVYAAGGTSFITTPHPLIRSTDQFASFIPQSFGVSVSTVNSVDGYTGPNGSIVYATDSGATNFTVYKHQPGFDPADTFVNASAALGAFQTAQGVWVSPTLRAVAIGAQTTEQFGVYSPTLTSISILPTSSSTKAFQQFYATGTFSNGDVHDVTDSVTWHSSNTGAATISATGLATSVANGGTTNITATYSALTSNTAVMTTNTWIQQTSGVSVTLNSVFGFSSTNIYAVGNTGTILHWNGSSWSAQTSGTTDNFMQVQGPDASHIYAYTSTNNIYESHDGTTWSLRTAPGGGIHAIWATTSTDMWVTENGNRFQHSANDAVSWSTDIGNVGSNSGTYLFGFSPSDMWEATSGGTEIMRYDGSGTSAANWHDWPNTTVGATVHPGDTTITLTDATYFSKTGYVRIDSGTGSDETILYTGKSGNTLTGCTRAGSFTHNVGAFAFSTNNLGAPKLGSVPAGFGTNAIWGTSSSDLFIAGGFFNGGGIYYSTDRFTTATGIGPDSGFVPSDIHPNSIFGGNNFVYATGTNQALHFAIITYDRAKNLWSTTYEQNLSSNSAKSIWVDATTGYAVAVGEGGTIVKKG